MGPAPATLHLKFYFQHLSADEQRRFVELVNAGKITGLYVLPFFCRREAPLARAS